MPTVTPRFSLGGIRDIDSAPAAIRARLKPPTSFSLFKATHSPELNSTPIKNLVERTPLSNQDDEDCTANATCDAFEILIWYQSPDQDPPQLSRRFTYYVSRVWETPLGKGAFIPFVFQQQTSIGTVLESDWDYSKGVNTPPPLELYRVAAANRIDGYYEITSSGSERLFDIIRAINANHPVVFGTALGSDFMGYFNQPARPQGIVDGLIGSEGVRVFDPPTFEDIQGYHAMIVVGYDVTDPANPKFRLRNSWGENFGNTDDPGHVWVSASYMTSDRTTALFVPTLIPTITSLKGDVNGQ
jgi:Papain family cysteine protease